MVGSKCRDFKSREVSNVNAPNVSLFLLIATLLQKTFNSTSLIAHFNSEYTVFLWHWDKKQQQQETGKKTLDTKSEANKKTWGTQALPKEGGGGGVVVCNGLMGVIATSYLKWTFFVAWLSHSDHTHRNPLLEVKTFFLLINLFIFAISTPSL